MQERHHCVYIMASKPYGTLYIGVTSDLEQRVASHKNELYANAFTKKYNIKMLVYYEEFQYIEDAIVREKAMKAWKREWKLNVIKA